MTIPALHTAAHEAGQPVDGPSPLLVLLHGYGSDEADLLGLAPHLDPRFRIVSVRAPLALDMGGYAWFPIEFTDAGLRVDYAAGDRSVQSLADLLATEQARHGNSAENTFVLGFSQGGAMAMSLLLAQPDRIGGVAFLSGLWSQERMPADPAMAGVVGKPVLQTHGSGDPLIPISAAHTSRQLLTALGVELTYREYGMGHQIDADCLHDVGAWLTDRLTDYL